MSIALFSHRSRSDLEALITQLADTKELGSNETSNSASVDERSSQAAEEEEDDEKPEMGKQGIKAEFDETDIGWTSREDGAGVKDEVLDEKGGGDSEAKPVCGEGPASRAAKEEMKAEGSESAESAAHPKPGALESTTAAGGGTDETAAGVGSAGSSPARETEEKSGEKSAEKSADDRPEEKDGKGDGGRKSVIEQTPGVEGSRAVGSPSQVSTQEEEEEEDDDDDEGVDDDDDDDDDDDYSKGKTPQADGEATKTGCSLSSKAAAVEAPAAVCDSSKSQTTTDAAGEETEDDATEVERPSPHCETGTSDGKQAEDSDGTAEDKACDGQAEDARRATEREEREEVLADAKEAEEEEEEEDGGKPGGESGTNGRSPAPDSGGDKTAGAGEPRDEPGAETEAVPLPRKRLHNSNTIKGTCSVSRHDGVAVLASVVLVMIITNCNLQ